MPRRALGGLAGAAAPVLIGALLLGTWEAVVLQVTLVVAVAPLILIYVQHTLSAVILCAWLVAFFPVLSNTMLGLASADHNLRDLFALYRSSRWQQLRHLRLPSALPYFLGLRIAGGLSLIGAVVAEFVAGTTGTGTGLAFRCWRPSTLSLSRACSRASSSWR